MVDTPVANTSACARDPGLRRPAARRCAASFVEGRRELGRDDLLDPRAVLRHRALVVEQVGAVGAHPQHELPGLGHHLPRAGSAAAPFGLDPDGSTWRVSAARSARRGRPGRSHEPDEEAQAEPADGRRVWELVGGSSRAYRPPGAARQPTSSLWITPARMRGWRNSHFHDPLPGFEVQTIPATKGHAGRAVPQSSFPVAGSYDATTGARYAAPARGGAFWAPRALDCDGGLGAVRVHVHRPVAAVLGRPAVGALVAARGRPPAGR